MLQKDNSITVNTASQWCHASVPGRPTQVWFNFFLVYTSVVQFIMSLKMRWIGNWITLSYVPQWELDIILQNNIYKLNSDQAKALCWANTNTKRWKQRERMGLDMPVVLPINDGY